MIKDSVLSLVKIIAVFKWESEAVPKEIYYISLDDKKPSSVITITVN